MATIIDDNANADNHSFLYYLHEERIFHVDSLLKLCNYMNAMNSITIKELKQLYFIQNQISRHIAYHFDPKDSSEILNLPKEYWEYVNLLDCAISKLENMDINQK